MKQHGKSLTDDNRLEGEVIEALKTMKTPDGRWSEQMKDLAELMDRHARHWKGYATGTTREEIILADFVAYIARAVDDAKREQWLKDKELLEAFNATNPDL